MSEHTRSAHHNLGDELPDLELHSHLGGKIEVVLADGAQVVSVPLDVWREANRRVEDFARGEG